MPYVMLVHLYVLITPVPRRSRAERRYEKTISIAINMIWNVFRKRMEQSVASHSVDRPLVTELLSAHLFFQSPNDFHSPNLS
jgi:hypothetical protein